MYCLSFDESLCVEIQVTLVRKYRYTHHYVIVVDFLIYKVFSAQVLVIKNHIGYEIFEMFPV